MNAVVLDKTGTITEGKPVVTDMQWADEAQAAQWKSVLLAMESQSEHPLAEAVVARLKEEDVRPASVSNFTSLTGRGVQATGEDGMTYYVGNQKLLDEHGIASTSTARGLIPSLIEVEATS